MVKESTSQLLWGVNPLDRYRSGLCWRSGQQDWSGGNGSRRNELWEILRARNGPRQPQHLRCSCLLKVSGVPLSENKYDKKYGDRKDYKAWKENTPMFFPKF